MAEIRSKTQFVDLYIKGLLGNRFRVWTEEQFYDYYISDCSVVGLREMGKPGGKFEMVNTKKNIERTWIQWEFEGRKFYLNEGDNETQKRATIQGEIVQRPDGWNIYIGPANVYKMRDMFKHQLANHYHGLRARLMLRHYLDQNSIDDIDLLLEQYPDAVVEFTSYSCNVGVLPNRNTIIWEVRNY